ncbi:MAG: polyprenyl synthetase family protein [Deltaproteobacteria bacterium]|jgi:geranylgeranyl pyrophosphate synthase|nr:polyprenyl synthetase family protein [Deltaproteobacteria bacterium]
MANIVPNEQFLKLWSQKSIITVNQELRLLFLRQRKNQPDEIQNLLEAMDYTLSSGGKRLRALLTLATTEACGGKFEVAMPGALAVELVHAYSLIHDDLPDLDDDDYRRGQLSCHKVFGNAVAILAGDCLQSLAFELLLSNWKGRRAPYGSLKAAYILAKAIGPQGMAGGQAMDLAFENHSPPLAQIQDMGKRKTGRLLSAAMAIGATLAEASIQKINIAAKAGLAAGLAFQIKDDLLNQEGDPTVMGKSVGTDAERGKSTLAALLGPKKAAEAARVWAASAKKISKNLNSPKLDWLIGTMVDRKS